jgi:hypothetical protein
MIGRALNSPGDVAMRRFKLFGTNERKSVRRNACRSKVVTVLRERHASKLKIKAAGRIRAKKARIQSVEDVLKTAACAAADCR